MTLILSRLIRLRHQHRHHHHHHSRGTDGTVTRRSLIYARTDFVPQFRMFEVVPCGHLTHCVHLSASAIPPGSNCGQTAAPSYALPLPAHHFRHFVMPVPAANPPHMPHIAAARDHDQEEARRSRRSSFCWASPVPCQRRTQYITSTALWATRCSVKTQRTCARLHVRDSDRASSLRGFS